ncbi:MAG: hypothetical protein QM669_10545 [Siphonobacter sp.]
MCKTVLVLYFLGIQSVLYAQEKVKALPLAYKTTWAVGITSNSNSGLVGGLAVRHSILQTSNWRGTVLYRYFNLEVVNVKDPQENRIQTTGDSFISDKQNSFLVTRAHWGREVAFLRQPTEDGVQLTGAIAIGPSVGLTKPYYIQYRDPSSQIVTEIPYDPLHSTLNQDNIVGSGSPLKGFNQATIYPGANVKLGVIAELAAFPEGSVGLEVGGLLEYMPGNVIILASKGSLHLFPSGYITFFVAFKRTPRK